MINNKIKSRRIELKMTAKQLSEKTGLTPAYISQLENGKRENPSTDVMDKIANALCTTIDYLLNKTEKKELQKAEQKIEELSEEKFHSDIVRIERARRKMPKDEQENMMKVLEAAFAKYFND